MACNESSDECRRDAFPRRCSCCPVFRRAGLWVPGGAAIRAPQGFPSTAQPLPMRAERSQDHLVKPKGIRGPYMILTFDATERWPDILGAIHPFNRTLRPAEVSPERNPSYHALLRDFERLTGTAVLVNTSSNLHGEPIVTRPQAAPDVLDRSGLTYLVIAGRLVKKR
jgi:predicted NodU family carbamoyl transferase